MKLKIMPLKAVIAVILMFLIGGCTLGSFNEKAVKDAIVLSGVEKANELAWEDAISLIYQGKVTAVSQTYWDANNNTIAWIMVDGELHAVRETDTTVVEEIQKCGKQCENIRAMKVGG